MSRLTTKTLTKRFGGLVAVKGVDFELADGEILGIIGPNGAGKSTLINLISGIHFPTSGQIFYNGEEITYMPPHERSRIGIGRTYQIIHPLENLNVIENIMVGCIFAQQLKKKEARKMAEELCDVLQLTNVERPVSELSILEVKKLEIAHALAIDPKILFLDEVMAGLNIDETDEVISMIKNVAGKKKIGIGVVEHVMSVIKKLTKRVIVLDAGEIIAEGPYSEVSQNRRVIEAYLGGEA